MALGAQFTVNVTVSNATNVGSYEVLLEYAFNDLGAFEPDVFEFAGVANGPFLGSTGRPVTCLDPAVDHLSVRFGCVTSGPLPPGPSGSGTLASFTFRVLKPSTRPMALSVNPSTGGLSDPLGQPLSFLVSGATTVTIGAPTGLLSLAGAAPGAPGRSGPDPERDVGRPAERRTGGAAVRR